MRICFLSSMHPATDKRVFYKEAQTLAAAGYEVIHLAPGDGREWVQEGVRIVTYARRGGLWARFTHLVSLYRHARRLDADVYHCNEVDSWIVGVALRVFAGRVCVFDVHEHYPEDFAEFRCPPLARPAARRLVAILMWILSRLTSRIVLAKSSLQRFFAHLPNDRVALVQNFVPLSALRGVSPPRRLQPPLKLIHLGMLTRARGWPQMLEAMATARSRNVELLVLGEINDGSADDFHADVRRLGLMDRVRYEAWLPYEEAMAHVNQSDVGLVLFQPGFYSHVHALPHKMFDYMVAELAMIAPNFALEVAAIVKDAQCGLLIDPSNPREIADAIDHLCDRPELLQAYGRRGRDSVVRRYNWEAEAEKLVAMYRKLEQAVHARDVRHRRHERAAAERLAVDRDEPHRAPRA